MKYIKTFEEFTETVNEATSIHSFFGEMSSFPSAGVDKEDLKKAKKSKITDKNNKEFKKLIDGWIDGRYDEDPNVLVDELRYLLESVINEEKVMPKKQIEKIVKELKADGGTQSDDEAFDIADGVLYDEEGMEAGIRKHFKVSDPQGWLADRI